MVGLQEVGISSILMQLGLPWLKAAPLGTEDRQALRLEFGTRLIDSDKCKWSRSLEKLQKSFEDAKRRRRSSYR
jgi:hypothetical protein